MSNTLLNDDHLYGYFMGRVTPSNIPDPAGFISIRFDGVETKHYDNDRNNGYLENNGENKNVYKVFSNNVLQFVSPLNESIPNSNTPAENNNITEENFLELVKRGDYGCIPKFEANQAGHIAYSVDINNIYTIPLIVAVHISNNPSNIISNFQLRPFRMTKANYDKLNGLFAKNRDMEGGLDKINGSSLLKLKVDNGIDPELIITEI